MSYSDMYAKQNATSQFSNIFYEMNYVLCVNVGTVIFPARAQHRPTANPRSAEVLRRVGRCELAINIFFSSPRLEITSQQDGCGRGACVRLVAAVK